MVAQCLAAGSLAAQRPASSASSSAFAQGRLLSVPRPAAALCNAQRLVTYAAAAAAIPQTERLRLNNLSPQEGSRRKAKRKGRGYGAGQGGSCGFGMRGQKSRSGSGTRPGFEGGQTSLYRRLPKLRGIAGGMPAGVPSYNVINLGDLELKFKEGDEVSLETLQEKRVFNLSGREAKLPLKVLGDGEMPFPLTIKAETFSEAARQKIEAAGGTIVEVPRKPTWTRKLHAERLVAAGKDPSTRAKKNAAKANK